MTFEQTEGETTNVIAAPLVGLRAGHYHLVIHENATCGLGAGKAGRPWPVTAGAALMVEVEAGRSRNTELSSTELELNGGGSIVGRTLVLHDDKKGTPGHPIACGSIESEDEPDSAPDK